MQSPIATCDLCDQFPNEVRVLEPIFKDFGGIQHFSGPVRTVKCFEDNSKVKALVSTTGHGHVLVVDGGASPRRSLLGGNLAAKALENGWSGVIVYGFVRDALELKATRLGIKALGLIPVKTDKKDIGDIDVPITFAGHPISPGDYIYADIDGIVVASRALHQ